MANQELYEMARERIDRRYRRWRLWAFNLAGLIFTVALLVLLSDTGYEPIAAALMMTWAGQFVAHTILVGMAHSRDEDIEKEVAKLRDAAFEKPKRLGLSEEGEIVEAAGWEADAEERRLRS